MTDDGRQTTDKAKVFQEVPIGELTREKYNRQDLIKNVKWDITYLPILLKIKYKPLHIQLTYFILVFIQLNINMCICNMRTKSRCLWSKFIRNKINLI